MKLLPVIGALMVSTVDIAPVHAKPTGVPIHPSARCAVFWSAMTRAVPQDSRPYKEMTARKDAWLAHAATVIGTSEANRILNADGPHYGNQVREMAGDAAAIQAFAAKYSDCETVPAAPAQTALNAQPAAAAKPVAAVTEKNKENGERAFACSGMAQMNATIGNFIAVDLYGTEATYLPIIKHFRPDLTDAQIKSGVTAGLVQHAKRIKSDEEARRSQNQAGKQWDSTQSEVVKFSGECARMANVMSRIIKK